MTNSSLSTFPLTNLGPFAAFAGIWEGDKGRDVAPGDDRGTETNLFRERIELIPFGPVNNHEQTLWGLRYKTTAWRLGVEDSFHEELGLWLWDPGERQAMRSFIVPRGVTVLAGGTIQSDEAKEIRLNATLGSSTYGICSNPFLDREFQTVKYELTLRVLSNNSFQYEEITWLKIKGQSELFAHKDSNTLYRV